MLGSRDGQSILGSRDTLTRGCSVFVPIRVLYCDGQSISASRDTLTGRPEPIVLKTLPIFLSGNSYKFIISTNHPSYFSHYIAMHHA